MGVGFECPQWPRGGELARGRESVAKPPQIVALAPKAVPRSCASLAMMSAAEAEQAAGAVPMER